MTVKIWGHPVHQMLVPFPIGLLGTGLVFDAIDIFGGPWIFGTVGWYMIVAGLIGGVLAALFGLADYSSISKESRVKQIASGHLLFNLLAVAFFVISAIMRWGGHTHRAGFWVLSLEVAGGLCLLISGWIGGELIDRYHVGIEDTPQVPPKL